MKITYRRLFVSFFLVTSRLMLIYSHLHLVKVLKSSWNSLKIHCFRCYAVLSPLFRATTCALLKFRLRLTCWIAAGTPSLEINYCVQKIGGLRSQWNSVQMNNWHPWQLKKSKFWGPFWSYIPAKQHYQFSPFCPISW